MTKKAANPPPHPSRKPKPPAAPPKVKEAAQAGRYCPECGAPCTTMFSGRYSVETGEPLREWRCTMGCAHGDHEWRRLEKGERTFRDWLNSRRWVCVHCGERTAGICSSDW